MGMALPMGGHLTHGWSVSATGRWFRSVQYGVRKETGRVDMDEVRELALAERPKVIFCGGTAIPRTIDFPAFASIAAEVDAILVADIAHIAGLVAGGAHPSPVGHAAVITTTTHKTLRGPRGAMVMSTAEHAKAIDKAVFPGLQGGPHNSTTAAIAVALKEAATDEFRRYAHAIVANAKALGDALSARGFDLVSGGTDNHLLLVDLENKQISGKLAAQALDRAGLELNYNTVPFDPRKPFDPSGVRLGTPAVTSRGMSTDDMVRVAEWIDVVVEAATAGDESAIEKVAGEVHEFARAFPMPGLPT
jgi:glycine hydroxymethyltransferase